MSEALDIAREQAFTRGIHVRLADNSEGEIIRNLVSKNGFTINGINWNDIYPYWLCATMDNEIIGCIQVCIGKPIGRLEILCVKPGISHIQKALTIKTLLLAGSETLRQAGAQMACGIIPFSEKSYKRILRSHGCVTISSGNMMIKALTNGK